MRRILSWIVWIPIAIVLISFVVANRQWVTLSLDPVNVAHPFFAIALPLWAVLVLGLFMGLIAGWFAAWVKARHARKRARVEHAELERMRRAAATPAPQNVSTSEEPANPLIVI